MKNYISILFAATLLVVSSCKSEKPKEHTAQLPAPGSQERAELEIDNTDKAINKYVADNKLDTNKTINGLVYIITKTTQGRKINFEDKVSMKYKGTFLDGSQFDAGTYDFKVGAQQVIRGWDEAAMLMKEGEKATLIIPYWLAYGEIESPPIKPYSTLVFDVEALKVTPSPQE